VITLVVRRLKKLVSDLLGDKYKIGRKRIELLKRWQQKELGATGREQEKKDRTLRCGHNASVSSAPKGGDGGWQGREMGKGGESIGIGDNICNRRKIQGTSAKIGRRWYSIGVWKLKERD